MIASPEVPANLEDDALRAALDKICEQASWCPKIAVIPHYELQTLLSIGIREYLLKTQMRVVPVPARSDQKAAKRAKGPPQQESKRQRVLERDKFVCYLCGQPIQPDDASIDHVIPKSKGGNHSMGNLRAAHKECNFRKGDMTLEEYLASESHAGRLKPSVKLVKRLRERTGT
ncbi:HNH endonuclease [Zavarzinella formosa]|uniref:HNH endonuclease n=1 Tax=Zavarzinella formosa TaxID=360055 RepID=UPI00036177DC|nr:HNH endonuclease [Zavarzinella formosa]